MASLETLKHLAIKEICRSDVVLWLRAERIMSKDNRKCIISKDEVIGREITFGPQGKHLAFIKAIEAYCDENQIPCYHVAERTLTFSGSYRKLYEFEAWR
jgi:hypothetical protein